MKLSGSFFAKRDRDRVGRGRGGIGSPIAVAAMQAGKDVYVEKPASHVFREGRLPIETQQRYKRICAVRMNEAWSFWPDCA